MLIDIKPRIIKPPFGSVRVDMGHSLARNLVFCSLINPTPVDLVTGSFPSFPVALAQTESPKGPGITFDGTQKFNYRDRPNWQPGNTPYSMSIVVLANPISEAVDRGLMGKENPVTPFAGYWLEANIDEIEGLAAGKIHFEIRNGSTQQRSAASDTTRVDGKYHMFGGRYDGVVSDLADVFSDGTLVTSARSTLTPMAAITDTTSLNVGDVGSTASNAPSTATIIFAYLWHRALTNQEFQWLFAEPYAFLETVPSMRYWSVPTVAVAAASHYGTASPDPGGHVPLVARFQ